MAKYTVILSSRVEAQLRKHMEFLARVSIPAAKRFRAEYARILDRLENNPHQFPLETDPNLPAGLYREALFARRYKALFSIAEDTVYLDAVVDCRQQNEMLDS
jgi:hypothetical protein